MNTIWSHEAPSGRRNQTACEACRATKIRCQPSEQPGVCRKCLDSKRECVSRTGPRTRRPRRAKNGTPPPRPPSQAAPSTFSIDFEVPVQDDVNDSFDVLRETHEQAMDKIFPPEDDDAFTFSSALATPPASSSTPSSSTPSLSIETLHGKPQFNLSSAESLLTAFRSMLSCFPCIVLPNDATVSRLAATRPFVLLAILAAASGSRTLQGHSLYDDEFRKVLALKFVAGGERTLDLLQGIIIYCAWYPFHLRPRNKHVFHYIRMAADLIHDLELDQESSQGFILGMEPPLDHQLDAMRAYLSYFCFVGAFMVGWRKYRNLSATFTPWTAACCDALEHNAQSNKEANGDMVLSTLVRLSSISSEVSDAIHDRRGERTDQQTRLLLLGLETQARELRQRLPPHIAATNFYPNAGSLIAIPVSPAAPSVTPTAPKLAALLPSLALFLSETLRLEPAAFSCFTAVDWSRLIVAIILAFRLSLSVPECPSFDHLSARTDLRLGEFLDAMSRETEVDPAPSSANTKVDILSASRVVMRVVKTKFDRRVDLADRKDAVARGVAGGCPMLDGSLDQYLPLWDAGLCATDTTNPTTTMSGGGGQKPVFHDLWATMTMGWADEACEP